MNTENETQLNIKKEMIQTEIIDKNYDKIKFFEYCTNHKENGDDLSNWTILELNEVISDFIALQTSTQPTQEETTSNPQQQQQEQQSPQTSTTQQISNDIIKTVDTTQSTSSPEENVIEISCKKLNLTPINNQQITVQIRNPKEGERTFFEGSYISYEVVTESMQWFVRRRYSDFEWLRSILVKCFPRILVPPLPGKKMGSRRFEEDFIQKRMLFLQKFMNRLLENETFKTNEALIAFLSFTDRNQFDSKMKEMTSYIPSPYVEDMKTLTGKIQIVYDEDNDKYYKNIQNYFRLQTQLFERLNYNMKTFYTNINEACLSLDEVQKDFETLHMLNSRIKMKDEITKTFEELGLFFKNWKRILYNQNDLFKTHVKDFFKFIRMEQVAYMELIDNREIIRRNYLEEQQRVNTKKERLYQTMDISKWEIVDVFNKIDRDLLLRNREYAMQHLCTKDTIALEGLHKQLGYANKSNMDELKKIINVNCEKFVSNIKEFAEKFYPTLNDGISVWMTLNNYL